MKTKRKLSQRNKLPVSKAKYAKVERAVRNYLNVAKKFGWQGDDEEYRAWYEMGRAMREAVS